MRVVYYEPDTGRIVAFVQGHEATIANDSRPFVPVDEVRDDWDVTHQVVDGQLVKI